MSTMISVRNLSKSFGPIHAVRGVSFDVEKGEVLGFLGPNGAGKSTTMKMITGFLAPTGGTAVVCGHDIRTDAIDAKARIGYLPEGAPLYADMTPRGFLKFVAAARGLGGAERQAGVDRAIALAQLSGVVNQPIDTLSKGFKRRVGLAQALIHDPDVLVLDEPTDGLDPNQKHEVRRIIHDMSAEKAIVISTHILEEVDAICSRALIIAQGEVVADGTPETLMQRSDRHNAVLLRIRKPSLTEAQQKLTAVPGVSKVDIVNEADGEALLVRPMEGQSIAGSVADFANNNKWEVVEIKVEQGDLDSVFRNITQPGRDLKRLPAPTAPTGPAA